MSDQSKVSSIILAAGTAKRMGKTKQLLKLKGKPLLQHVIDQVLEERFAQVITVIGHDATAIQHSIRIADQRFRWALNHAHEEGQSTTLKKGLQCLSEHAPHVMVFLGDMPFIKHSTIHCVFKKGLAAAKEKREPFVIRPVYKGRAGHPVFFGHTDKGFFDQLQGDRGAKMIIRKMTEVEEVLVEDKGVIWDVDTLEAYEDAKRDVHSDRSSHDLSF